MAQNDPSQEANDAAEPRYSDPTRPEDYDRLNAGLAELRDANARSENRNSLALLRGSRSDNSTLKYAGLGFQMVGIIGACAFLGWLADDHWDVAPAGVLVGSLTGCVVAIWTAIRAVLSDGGSARPRRKN